MIQIVLEDFEIHRPNLLKYATGLLKTRGFSNHKKGELDELAKDIVQNCYLQFQISNKNTFVSDKHFESFLKQCLYWNYQNEMDSKNRNTQWILFRKGEFDNLDVRTEFKRDLSTEQFDVISKFKEQLTEKQNFIVDELLKGFNGQEIADKMNISKQAVNDNLNHIRKKYKIYC